MSGILIGGSFFTHRGYSRFARAIALSLADLGVEVQIVDRPLGDPTVDGPTASRLRALERPVDARFAVHIDTPDRADPVPGVGNAIWTQFESDRLPDAWAESCRRFDLVIVPSMSSWDALARSGIDPDRLRLCPQGVDADLFATVAADRSLLAREFRGRPLGGFRTRFLNVSDIGATHRKNLPGLLAAWLRATTAGDSAILCLKWSSHWGPELARAQFAAMLDGVAEVLGVRAEDAAPVALLEDARSDADMPGLYGCFTHYASVSSGEGWDLPMMEAGAAGLRLIAPDHSGYRAYLNETNATLLPAMRVPADLTGYGAWQRWAHEGSHWWEVDLDAAARAIRDAIDGRDAYRPTARQALLRDFSWEAAARQLLAILAEPDGGSPDGQPEFALPQALPTGVESMAVGWPNAVGAAGAKPSTLRLVSALVHLEPSVLPPEDRIALLAPLFASGIPLVLYLDAHYFGRLQSADIPPWVTLRPFDPGRTAVAERIEAVGGHLRLPAGANLGKDSRAFLALMNAKPELVARAVSEGLVDAPYTGFIDAGIAKVFADPAATFAAIRNADLAGLDSVLAPGIHGPRPVTLEQLADEPCWIFCGGLVILPTRRAAAFAALAMRGLESFLEAGRLTYEVNVWAMLAAEAPARFIWYGADFDDRIGRVPTRAERELLRAPGDAQWDGQAQVIGHSRRWGVADSRADADADRVVEDAT